MEQLLIIEDDIGLNQGLSKALKADDRQIISCHDLKAAREQLLCGSVSLILLDINLPDGSGLELLREVKENMPGVPVILQTAGFHQNWFQKRSRSWQRPASFRFLPSFF